MLSLDGKSTVVVSYNGAKSTKLSLVKVKIHQVASLVMVENLPSCLSCKDGISTKVHLVMVENVQVVSPVMV